jgi:DGQHR domain-containing protein
MENRTYFGWFMRQREDPGSPKFFVFLARTKDIINWTGTKRTQDFPDGTQRVLRKSRVKTIVRFLEASSINTIPNNILLAFQPDKVRFTIYDDTLEQCMGDELIFNDCKNQFHWGSIHFEFDPSTPEHKRIALIVDGQHRLAGMANFQTENLPILVIAMLDSSIEEQAFQFIVINNKAVRAPTDNVKSIIAESYDDTSLKERLLNCGVTYGNNSPLLKDVDDLDISPFQHLLKWSHNRDGVQLVQLTTIEQCINYISDTFNFLVDDEDSLKGLFFAVWRAVKVQYPNLWGQDNKFMTKVNINALNEFIVQILKVAWTSFNSVDIFDPEDVESKVLRYIKFLPEEYWLRKWTIKIQDNSNVRETIKRDLNTITDNVRLTRPWDHDLVLAMQEQEE